MPIGGGKPPAINPDDFEDKPVPKGAYNLDNLPADAFGDGGGALINEPAKPRKAPPARFANKQKAEETKEVAEALV